MIKLKKVSKFYNVNKKVVRTLNEVDVDFCDNEIVLIKGKSGSGKSTLLKLISSDILCDMGECNTIKDITSVYQDFQLIEAYTTYENIFFAVNLYYDREKAVELTQNIIKDLNLENVRNVKAYKLSTGERQRVAIARALLSKNNVIIFDEPTSNLDDNNTKIVIKIIEKYSLNKLFIIASHDERFDDIAGRIIVLENGSIVFDVINKKNENKNEEIIYSTKYNLKYVVTHNFIRYPLVTIFSFIIMMLISMLLIFSFLAIDKITMTPKTNPILGLTDDKTLIYDKKGIVKSELNNLNSYEINPFYLTYSIEFDTDVTNGENRVIASYESVKLTNLDYGRIPESSNEVCLYIPMSLKDNILKELYCNAKFSIPNSDYSITIVGIKYVDGIDTLCFAYNDVLKNYLNYTTLDFYINNSQAKIIYGDTNKLVLPNDYKYDSLLKSFYVEGSNSYEFNYEIDVAYENVEKPILYLSLDEALEPNEIYEVLVFDNIDNISGINHSMLDLSEYNTYKISKDTALKNSVKILLVLVSTITLVIVLIGFYYMICSFENDVYKKIKLLIKDNKLIIKTKIIESIIKALASLVILTLGGVILIGVLKTIFAIIFFILLNMLMLKKVGEVNA